MTNVNDPDSTPRNKMKKWKGSLRKGFRSLKDALKDKPEKNDSSDRPKEGIDAERDAFTLPSLTRPSPCERDISTEQAYTARQVIDEFLSDSTSTDHMETTSAAITSQKLERKPLTLQRLPLRNLYRDGTKGYGLKDAIDEQRSTIDPPSDQPIKRFKVKMARPSVGSPGSVSALPSNGHRVCKFPGGSDEFGPQTDGATGHVTLAADPRTGQRANTTDNKNDSSPNDLQSSKAKDRLIISSGEVEDTVALDGIQEPSYAKDFNIRARFSSVESKTSNPVSVSSGVAESVLRSGGKPVITSQSETTKIGVKKNRYLPVLNEELFSVDFPVADHVTTQVGGTGRVSTVRTENQADHERQQNSVCLSSPDVLCSPITQHKPAAGAAQEVQTENQTKATTTNQSPSYGLITTNGTEHEDRHRSDKSLRQIEQEKEPVKQLTTSRMSEPACDIIETCLQSPLHVDKVGPNTFGGKLQKITDGIRCMQKELEEHQNSVTKDASHSQAFSKEEPEDEELDIAMQRLAEKTEKLKQAAIAVRDQKVTLSDEEIAMIQKECPTGTALYKSIKDLRREHHDELHKAGAPLAPRAMREKEARTPSGAHSQPRYPKSYHSWGKNKSVSYTQDQIAREYYRFSNNHPQSQERYNPMPRSGKPKSAYSYQHQHYHSQSLPRNVIPPTPSSFSHLPNGRNFQTMPRRWLSAGLISPPLPTYQPQSYPSHPIRLFRKVDTHGSHGANKGPHQPHILSKNPPKTCPSRSPVLPTLNPGLNGGNPDPQVQHVTGQDTQDSTRSEEASKEVFENGIDEVKDEDQECPKSGEVDAGGELTRVGQDTADSTRSEEASKEGFKNGRGEAKEEDQDCPKSGDIDAGGELTHVEQANISEST